MESEIEADQSWDGETWWETIWPDTRWRLRWQKTENIGLSWWPSVLQDQKLTQLPPTWNMLFQIGIISVLLYYSPCLPSHLNLHLLITSPIVSTYTSLQFWAGLSFSHSNVNPWHNHSCGCTHWSKDKGDEVKIYVPEKQTKLIFLVVLFLPV